VLKEIRYAQIKLCEDICSLWSMFSPYGFKVALRQRFSTGHVNKVSYSTNQIPLRLQMLTELIVRLLFLLLNVPNCVVAKRNNVFPPWNASLSPMLSRTYRFSTCSKMEVFFQYYPGDISKVPRYKRLPWAAQLSVSILSLLNQSTHDRHESTTLATTENPQPSKSPDAHNQRAMTTHSRTVRAMISGCTSVHDS
jgi:hypothetical protein